MKRILFQFFGPTSCKIVYQSEDFGDEHGEYKMGNIHMRSRSRPQVSILIHSSGKQTGNIFVRGGIEEEDHITLETFSIEISRTIAKIARSYNRHYA